MAIGGRTMGTGDPGAIEDVLSKQLLGHHNPLDLVGALVDLGVLSNSSKW
jgi:hypothetical protein